MFPSAWRWAGGGMLPGDLRYPLLMMEGLATRYGTVTDSPKRWSTMPDAFTVYRGGFTSGPCWTLSEKVAERFVRAQTEMRGIARAFREHGSDLHESYAHFDLEGEPVVMTIDVTKSEVIGFFWKRGEQEVVLRGKSWMEPLNPRWVQNRVQSASIVSDPENRKAPFPGLFLSSGGRI